ncbi:MAG: 3-carboxy-cis,cis-muconate cycloisomerase [Betaproteobacteria bacterium]|nr:3-carboxy-cis,cis-muconate cycloisomerase [Betaproteobacteria bacterium]
MNLFARVLIAPEIEAVFSDEALMAAMVRFEVELAGAQAQTGLIPPEAALTISNAAESFSINAQTLITEGAHAGTPIIPFVKALRAQVAKYDPRASDFVHFGTTSQDVMDTAMALLTREAVERLSKTLSVCVTEARHLALTHRDTPMLARTLMQAAGVTTFGYKAAQWCLALAQGQQRLLATARRALAVSLGGAVGNLAAYKDQGVQVRAALARRLDLHDPGHTWHTYRQNWIALATDTALLCGTMAKIAQDVALLAQSEVGEASEPTAEGRGGSSAMPHKRNPVLSLRVIAATRPIPGFISNLLATMPQEHERALGSWQAELAQWPSVFTHALSAVNAMAELLTRLEIHADKCKENIGAMQGVIFAEELARVLTPAMGKAEAESLMSNLCQRALRERRPLHGLLWEFLETDHRCKNTDLSEVAKRFGIKSAATASARLVEGIVDQIPGAPPSAPSFAPLLAGSESETTPNPAARVRRRTSGLAT